MSKKVLTEGKVCDNINKLSAGNPVSCKYLIKFLKRLEKKFLTKVKRCDRIAKLPFGAAGIRQDFLRKNLEKRC